jgi:hypothetical protein
MKIETLRRQRYIAQPNVHFVSFDVKDGFYAISIYPKDREAFTVNLDEQLLHLCALPMGWNLSPYAYQKFADVFVNKLRDPEATARPSRLPNLSAKAKKKGLRRRRLGTGARHLPFVDDFGVFANGFTRRNHAPQERDLRPREQSRLHYTPDQELPHNNPSGRVPWHGNGFREVRPPGPRQKLNDISMFAKNLLCSAAVNKRWVPVKALASLARKAEFLHLAIPMARFYLR